MEQTYQDLLDIMSAYLQDQKPALSQNVNWSGLIALAKVHNVTGILGYVTYSHRLCNDKQISMELRQSCFKTMSLFNQRYSYGQIFLDTLAQHGIDHIIMKGMVLRNLYPIPELRTFSDMDLVIRKEDRAKCHQLMLDLGFQVKTDWEPVFSYYKGNEYYEIHTELLEVDVSDKADYKTYFKDPWPHAKEMSPHRFEFSHEFHFLYLITHIAKHIHGSGAGIRMYMDVAVFLQRFGTTLDWTYIFAELDYLRLRTFAETVLRAVEAWFHIPSPVGLPELADDILHDFKVYTLEAGIFGKNNRDSAAAAMKYNSSQDKNIRLRHLLKQIFPDRNKLKRRYTYLEKFHWLLPVAWVHRFFKNFNDLGTFTEQAQSILTVEDEKILRLKKIINSIGL